MTSKANKSQVQIKWATVNDQGQRLDNYLIKILKGVPKSRIYKAVRGGEVRINGARVKASTRIVSGDKVRIPPLRVSEQSAMIVTPSKLLKDLVVIFEDAYLLVVDKPAGLAVHGGTGLVSGLIEALKMLRPQQPNLQLVHRLDRETSGCLVLAKDRQTLVKLQAQFAAKPDDRNKIQKYYFALVQSSFAEKQTTIDLCLSRERGRIGEKRTVIDAMGKIAVSRLFLVENYDGCGLVDIELITGRTHQARVHCASVDHPIAGDKLYGEKAFNREMNEMGLKRLFLHAHKITFTHPMNNKSMTLNSPLPESLQNVLVALKRK